MKLAIEALPGYDPHIGHLVSMMTLSRLATWNIVSNLDTYQLDYEVDETSNSIGSLLMHIGALELLTQIKLFENRYFNAAEHDKWFDALPENLSQKKIRGHSLGYYQESLNEVRKNTLRYLKERRDDWLYQEEKLPNGLIINTYFQLFHLVEDEISHTGQMIWLKKRIFNASRPIGALASDQ